jgi:hypothetical protein
MKGKPEACEPHLEVCKELLCFVPVLETDDGVFRIAVAYFANADKLDCRQRICIVSWVLALPRIHQTVDGERIFCDSCASTDVSEECPLNRSFFLAAHVWGLPAFVAPISTKLLDSLQLKCRQSLPTAPPTGSSILAHGFRKPGSTFQNQPHELDQPVDVAQGRFRQSATSLASNTVGTNKSRGHCPCLEGAIR